MSSPPPTTNAPFASKTAENVHLGGRIAERQGKLEFNVGGTRCTSLGSRDRVQHARDERHVGFGGDGAVAERSQLADGVAHQLLRRVLVVELARCGKRPARVVGVPHVEGVEADPVGPAERQHAVARIRLPKPATRVARGEEVGIRPQVARDVQPAATTGGLEVGPVM